MTTVNANEVALRDSGESTTADTQAPAYSLRDLAADARQGDDEAPVRASDARLDRPRGGGGVRRGRRGSPRRRPRRRTRDRRAHLGPYSWHRTPIQMANQLGVVFAKLNCKPRWRKRLPEIEVPTLVVHGRRDRFFPVGNGEAIAREIPGARLLVLEEAATAIPDAAAGEVAEAMLALG
jgi:pimeloyl-ACP methyl ester carboxylesterase